MAELFDFNTIVTLLVLVWIIFGFMSAKWKMGVVAMTGLVILEITGVLSFDDAFSYASSTNVVMIAGMFVLSGALQKTRLVTNLRHWMLAHAKSGTAIVAMYLIACGILVNFVMPTALVSMLLPFMNALDEDSKVQPSHLLFPGVVTAHAAQYALPLGTAFITANAIIEANGGGSDVLNIFSFVPVALPSFILVLLYFIFIGWKKYPANTLDTSSIKEYKEKESTISKRDETIIYVVFVVNMLVIILNSVLDSFPIDMYVMPVLSCVILCLLHIMDVTDVRNSLNIDTLFMLIGVLPLAKAMQNSNAATIVANTIVTLLGGNPSYPLFLIAFMIVGGILTQFMSNSATLNVFLPLAMVTCVELGYPCGGVYIALALMTTRAMLTPMASPSLAIAYGAGRYTIKDLLKANLPAWIISTASIFALTLIFYPA